MGSRWVSQLSEMMYNIEQNSIWAAGLLLLAVNIKDKDN